MKARAYFFSFCCICQWRNATGRSATLKKIDIRAAEIELPPEFSVYYARSWTELELELELIQTHMTQKPMLRVEVGALGARPAKN